MKNIIVLFFVLLISVPASGQLTNESNSDSITVDVTKDLKKRYKAMLLSFVFPSTGHAYAGNWHRGLGFAAVRVGSSLIAIVTLISNLHLDFSSTDDNIIDDYTKPGFQYVFYGSLITSLVFTIWEIIDAGAEVDRYNESITKKLTGNKIDFGIIKMNNGAGVGMRFNL